MNYKYTIFSLSTVVKSSGGEMIFSSEIQKPEQNEPVQRTNMYTATVLLSRTSGLDLLLFNWDQTNKRSVKMTAIKLAVFESF